MRDSKDTRTRVREQMDKLCYALTREANAMKGGDLLSTRMEVVKVVTGYLSMANREPEGAEGGDFEQWRNTIGGSAGGGAGAGDEPERDPDEGADGEPGDPDGADGDERPEGTDTAAAILNRVAAE